MATSDVKISKTKLLIFIFSIILLSGLSAAGASHALNIEVDKPGGTYIFGKDTVTFTATNNGDDDAYVACDYPMQAYTNPQAGQPNGVAQEQINSCYVLRGLPGAI